MAKFSPGITLTLEITRAANRYGNQYVDLGRADGWQLRFVNPSSAVAEGSVDLRAIGGPLLSGMR